MAISLLARSLEKTLALSDPERDRELVFVSLRILAFGNIFYSLVEMVWGKGKSSRELISPGERANRRIGPSHVPTHGLCAFASMHFYFVVASIPAAPQ